MLPNRRVFCTAGLLCLAWTSALAEGDLISRYQARVSATTAEQPRWATPLITTSPRVEQGFRTDFVRQTAPGGQSTWNLGGSKGLQIVPFKRTEMRFSPPPFFSHTDPRVTDGFGDVAFRVKYRLYGSNEEHHNAIVTALLGASVASGKNGNGSCCAVLTPALEMGKGLDRIAFTTAAAGSLPVTNVTKLGRQIAWNNAVQYQATHLLWVEAEINSTFYRGGRNDGKQQTFVTPGVIVSRMPLLQGAAGKGSPLMLTLGAGEQIALTHFNTYNHSPVFTARLRF